MVDVSAVQYLPETGGWAAGIPRIENGWRPTGGEVNPEADGGIANWQAQSLAARTKYLKDRVDLLAQTTNVEVTVGTAGQFATINAAIAELSLRRSSYKPAGVSAKIRLLAGFVMREQVFARGIDLSWIEIVGTDAQTTISQAHITQAVASAAADHKGAFQADSGAALPVLSQLFTMDRSAPGNVCHGVCLFGGSTGAVLPGAGVKAASGNSVFLGNGSSLSANGAIFSGAAQDGAFVLGCSSLNIASADLSGCSGRGVLVRGASVVGAVSAKLSGCAGGAIDAREASRVAASGSNCRSGTSDASTDIKVSGGAMVDAIGATGGTNVAVNTLSPNGIIFK